MTDETKLSGAAILEYFKPLHDWLKKENDVAIGHNHISQARVDDGDSEKPVHPVADDQYIPIAVGSVIGGLVLVAIVGYLVMRRRKNL